MKKLSMLVCLVLFSICFLCCSVASAELVKFEPQHNGYVFAGKPITFKWKVTESVNEVIIKVQRRGFLEETYHPEPSKIGRFQYPNNLKRKGSSLQWKLIINGHDYGWKRCVAVY